MARPFGEAGPHVFVFDTRREAIDRLTIHTRARCRRRQAPSARVADLVETVFWRACPRRTSCFAVAGRSRADLIDFTVRACAFSTARPPLCHGPYPHLPHLRDVESATSLQDRLAGERGVSAPQVHSRGDGVGSAPPRSRAIARACSRHIGKSFSLFISEPAAPGHTMKLATISCPRQAMAARPERWQGVRPGLDPRNHARRDHRPGSGRNNRVPEHKFSSENRIVLAAHLRLGFTTPTADAEMTDARAVGAQALLGADGPYTKPSPCAQIAFAHIACRSMPHHIGGKGRSSAARRGR